MCALFACHLAVFYLLPVTGGPLRVRLHNRLLLHQLICLICSPFFIIFNLILSWSVFLLTCTHYECISVSSLYMSSTKHRKKLHQRGSIVQNIIYCFLLLLRFTEQITYYPCPRRQRITCYDKRQA